MSQTLGETREAMARGCMELVENFVNNMKHEKKPFYILFCAKSDKQNPGAIRQSIKACFQRPPKILGLLVWYVDNTKGVFDFIPELSSPPDIPLLPELLSEKSEDFFPSIAQKASSFNVLVS